MSRSMVFSLLAMLGGVAAAAIVLIPDLSLRTRIDPVARILTAVLPLLYLLGLIALLARTTPLLGFMGTLGGRAAGVGLIFLAAGSAVYTIQTGFWITVIGMSLYCFGSVLLGLDSLRVRQLGGLAGKMFSRRAMPIPLAIALMIGGLIAWYASVSFLPYIPTAFIFGIGISWLILGGALLITQPRAADPSVTPISGWWG